MRLRRRAPSGNESANNGALKLSSCVDASSLLSALLLLFVRTLLMLLERESAGVAGWSARPRVSAMLRRK